MAKQNLKMIKEPELKIFEIASIFTKITWLASWIYMRKGLFPSESVLVCKFDEKEIVSSDKESHLIFARYY